MEKQTPPPLTTDQKLDVIVHEVRQLNRRDRLRTTAGFFSGFIHLAWFLFIIYLTWYSAVHFDELLEKITKQAAEQAAVMTGDGATNFLDSFSGEQLEALLQKAGGITNRPAR